jgi:uncharacterized protein (TIGR02301 family)
MPNASPAGKTLPLLALVLTALSVGCGTSVAQLWPGMESSPFASPQAAPQPAPRAVPRLPRIRHVPQAAAKPEPSKAEAQPTPAANEPPPPYEPELLRLSEILGALTYLRDICGAQDAESWRARMQALLDSEAKTATRKEHLAGAYNRGFHGYEISYRSCTPNAEVIIKRFSAEGEKIAHDVANRYGAS